MKNYCVFVYLTFLLSFYFIFSISLKNKNQLSKSELDDLIQYLADDTSEETQNLIEISSNTFDRGTGCEAMNKCSGKGTCQNGACMCDEGFDYFDCSINVLSNSFFI